jgi:hypothetical protein
MTVRVPSVLEQIPVKDLTNDEYMWDKIREHYQTLLVKGLWY